MMRSERQVVLKKRDGIPVIPALIRGKGSSRRGEERRVDGDGGCAGRDQSA